MEKRNVVSVAVVAIGALFIMNGCASLGQHAKGPVQTVLERTPDVPQPDWTGRSEAYWVQEGKIQSMGYAESSIDNESALDEAENIARTKLIQGVKESMLADFRQALDVQKADPRTGESLTSTFSKIVNTSKIIGISQKGLYSEKVSEKTGKEKRIFYRSYVLAEMMNANYDRNEQQAIASLKAQVKPSKAQRKIAENIEKFL